MQCIAGRDEKRGVYAICDCGGGDWERRSRRGLESFQGHSLAVKHPQTEGMHGMSGKYGGHDWDVNISRTVTYTRNGAKGREGALCDAPLCRSKTHGKGGELRAHWKLVQLCLYVAHGKLKLGHLFWGPRPRSHLRAQSDPFILRYWSFVAVHNERRLF